MAATVQIGDHFIEEQTNFRELISALRQGFAMTDIITPRRHHHDFHNPVTGADSTLLLMPAWEPGKLAGVKIATVSPLNAQFDLPAIHATYFLMDAQNGAPKAIFEAKNLTVKRTAAASALASSYLSTKNASSLLMIGTGALSPNLIRAHASVRPLKKVFVWGRNPEKSRSICKQLEDENFDIEPLRNIKDKISEVDIISCATLSKSPLVLGKYLRAGQHIDLVGSYNKHMREADDATIAKSSVFLDTFQSGLKESGDIVIPIENGTLNESDIKGDLYALALNKIKGRISPDEITVFKSVGHALEDLVAATYYYNKYING